MTQWECGLGWRQGDQGGDQEEGRCAEVLEDQG